MFLCYSKLRLLPTIFQHLPLLFWLFAFHRFFWPFVFQVFLLICDFLPKKITSSTFIPFFKFLPLKPPTAMPIMQPHSPGITRITCLPCLLPRKGCPPNLTSPMLTQTQKLWKRQDMAWSAAWGGPRRTEGMGLSAQGLRPGQGLLAR